MICTFQKILRVHHVESVYITLSVITGAMDVNIILMYPEAIFKMFSVRRHGHFWNDTRDCVVFIGVLIGSLAVLELKQKFN